MDIFIVIESGIDEQIAYASTSIADTLDAARRLFPTAVESGTGDERTYHENGQIVGRITCEEY